MEKISHLSSSRNIIPLFRNPKNYPTTCQSTFLHFTRIRASKGHEEQAPLIAKKGSKSPRRLITIPSSGRWSGKWTCDYVVSLRDLQLENLAEDGNKDTEVFVSLSLQKHTGFGLSVDGRVITSITRKCSSCSSPFCRKIDTSICVMVLPDRRDNRSTGMPEIGGDDPSVIYVKPGCEPDLSNFVQDTIRLQTAVQDTCSVLCEESELEIDDTDEDDQETASVDKRWSGLFQLRNKLK